MSEECKECGEELNGAGECAECDYPPESYVNPGQETLMYVNAYRVTRHFGGPEEGGWWFNDYQPIACIPIKAVSHKGHDSSCWNCSRAGEELKHVDGEPVKACRWGFHLVPDETQEEQFKTHLQTLFAGEEHGNIYSVLGGAELSVCLEDHEACSRPRPQYE